MVWDKVNLSGEPVESMEETMKALEESIEAHTPEEPGSHENRGFDLGRRLRGMKCRANEDKVDAA